MLASMVRSTRPTRAEATDVANAVYDGTDALMLSEETAIGQHPVEAVRMMSRIAEVTERDLPYDEWLARRTRHAEHDVADTLSYSAVVAAYQLDLAALVVPTRSGRTARLVSAHHPRRAGAGPVGAARDGAAAAAPVRRDVGALRRAGRPSTSCSRAAPCARGTWASPSRAT